MPLPLSEVSMNPACVSEKEGPKKLDVPVGKKQLKNCLFFGSIHNTHVAGIGIPIFSLFGKS
jgi:hypothetical protein